MQEYRTVETGPDPAKERRDAIFSGTLTGMILITSLYWILISFRDPGPGDSVYLSMKAGGFLFIRGMALCAVFLLPGFIKGKLSNFTAILLCLLGMAAAALLYAGGALPPDGVQWIGILLIMVTLIFMVVRSGHYQSKEAPVLGYQTPAVILLFLALLLFNCSLSLKWFYHSMGRELTAFQWVTGTFDCFRMSLYRGITAGTALKWIPGSFGKYAFCYVWLAVILSVLTALYIFLYGEPAALKEDISADTREDESDAEETYEGDTETADVDSESPAAYNTETADEDSAVDSEAGSELQLHTEDTAESGEEEPEVPEEEPAVSEEGPAADEAEVPETQKESEPEAQEPAPESEAEPQEPAENNQKPEEIDSEDAEESEKVSEVEEPEVTGEARTRKTASETESEEDIKPWEAVPEPEAEAENAETDNKSDVDFEAETVLESDTESENIDTVEISPKADVKAHTQTADTAQPETPDGNEPLPESDAQETAAEEKPENVTAEQAGTEETEAHKKEVGEADSATEAEPSAEENTSVNDTEKEKAPDLTLSESVSRYALNFASYMSLDHRKRIFKSEKTGGYIAYTVIGKEAIISGPPLCPTDDYGDVLSEFESYCRGWGISQTWINVPEQAARIMKDLGYDTVFSGAEPIFELDNFKLTPPVDDEESRKAMLSKYHVYVREYRYYEKRNEKLEERLNWINDEWTDSRNPDRFTVYRRRQRDAFLPRTLEFDHEGGRRYYYASDASDHVLAFIVFCPIDSDSGYSCEAGRRVKRSPENIMELIMYRAYAGLKAEGVRWTGMGLMPGRPDGSDISAGQRRWIDFVYRYYQNIYSCRDYKEALPKYHPTRWSNIYLVTKKFRNEES